VPDHDVQERYSLSPWRDPDEEASKKPYSLELDPRLRLPPSYFLPPEANGTAPAAGDVFGGQYDAGGGGGGNALDAAAGNVDELLQHPGGSPLGINPGAKSLQYAPQGGIIPGLIDTLRLRPYFEGVPGMGPPGMPPPWASGR
jgi:hypothetical protein